MGTPHTHQVPRCLSPDERTALIERLINETEDTLGLFKKFGVHGPEHLLEVWDDLRAQYPAAAERILETAARMGLYVCAPTRLTRQERRR